MRILRTGRSRAAVSIAATVATVGALCMALAGLSSAVPAVGAVGPPACTAGTAVRTAGGPVCGVTAGGVTSYLGIPYAAPPLGTLRWAPPHPARPWAGTLRATAEGSVCPSPSSSGAPVGSEDCLNLDVRVPAGVRPGARLPVMVEIHGGGFRGTASGDFSHLVTAGHVIAVNMNYRLGILGFMANEALGAHSGDYGLQDQQAALRWVQRNIARFGGNPRNVTIFGQSAGGASVCDQVASPTARGLFQRGISQSGFYNSASGVNNAWQPGDCKSVLPTERQAQAAGARFAAAVGCGTAADVVACLRQVPFDTLIEQAGSGLGPDSGTMAPIVNGTTLTRSPGRAFATGHVNNIPLVIGVSRDELQGPRAQTPKDYRTLTDQLYGRLAPVVRRLYPLSRFPAPAAFIAFRTIRADADSVCPSLVADQNLARHGVSVWGYLNDNADTPNFEGLDPTVPNGAFHVAEDAFVRLNLSPNPNQAALGAQLTAEWIGFARAGNPTVTGTPLWTRYTKSHPDVMSLVPAGDSALVPASTLAAQHHCGFWDAVSWPTPRP